MKKFIVNLFSNRFGIVLATLNVCYFLSKESELTNYPFGKIFVCANFPAAISVFLSLEFIKIFSHPLLFSMKMSIANTFFPFFIVAQWLFIAWLAKTIAQKLRPTES